MMMDAKGQSLIEFIIFLPLFLLVYSFVTPYMSAIYGSINQQKITRHYFYYYTKNHSFLPKAEYNNAFYQGLNLNSFGMMFMGYAENFNQNVPISPCYEGSFGEENSCTASYSKKASSFIRVATVYGLCTATYLQKDGKVYLAPYEYAREVNAKEGCYLR